MKMGNKLGIVLFCLAGVAQASTGREGGNGGDMCENRFKLVADDIALWINRGGSAELNLPRDISVLSYNAEMTAQIVTAQVSCTAETIKVGDSEKTCENFVDEKGSPRIICNTQRFMATDESQQYVLVHHEYAGLSGLEVNSGENSNYSISNQISGYLVDEVVKKLAVKPRAPTCLESIKNVSCTTNYATLYSSCQFDYSLKSGQRSQAGDFFEENHGDDLPTPLRVIFADIFSFGAGEASLQSDRARALKTLQEHARTKARILLENMPRCEGYMGPTNMTEVQSLLTGNSNATTDDNRKTR